MLPPSRTLPLATIHSAERCESLLLDIVGFVHHFPGHYSTRPLPREAKPCLVLLHLVGGARLGSGCG